MKYPKVKICDVRSPEIAKFCRENSVDFIGLHQIFLPVEKEKIELFKSIKEVSGSMPIVLVTKIDDIDELAHIICEVSFDYVQLHFATTVDFVKELKQRVRKEGKREIGVISVFQANKCDFSLVQEMGKVADYILFDSFIEGGTGRPISDEAIKLIVQYCSHLNYFIAGGLNPGNVQLTIAKAHPFALDVQTGVECEKHVKDKGKIQDFVKAAHTYSD